MEMFIFGQNFHSLNKPTDKESVNASLAKSSFFLVSIFFSLQRGKDMGLFSLWHL
jgi:hypothetical protein